MSMETFISSGNVVLVIAAVMLIEAVLLLLYLRRFPAMLMGLAAGLCLVLALGAALQQKGWASIAALLGSHSSFISWNSGNG